MPKKTATNPFVAEGNRLALPCMWLRLKREKNAPVCGFYGGKGAVKVPRPWEHVMMVDCSWLAKLGFELRGCLYVLRCDQGFFAANDPDAQLPPALTGAKPLYAEEGRSLLPGNGVVAYGSKEFRQWWYGRTRKATDEQIDQWGHYHEEWVRYSPWCTRGKGLVAGRMAAMLGGWHFNTPENLLPKRRARREDGDPRFDNFHCGNNRLVMSVFQVPRVVIEVWQDRRGQLRTWGIWR